jgi:transposase InsO family protein
VPIEATRSEACRRRPDANEVYWSRKQVELLDQRRWHTRVELANAIFEYLEDFHNRQRRHSSLGMLTPMEFEDAPTVA